MRRSFAGLRLVLLAALLLASPVRADDAEPPEVDEEREGRGLVHRLVTYVPNRVLDALDIVRVRVRVGPGFGIGLRATELADFYVGSYTSIYVGLPGPRGRVLPRLPVGIESRSGIEVGPVDLSGGLGTGPDYGPAEVGGGFHAVLVGVDVGIEPLEIVDFALGLITLDPLGDDF